MHLKIIFYVICFVSHVLCAPRSRNRQQVSYDQKQTGDYNIQLHLKDFQIVALLGEDTIGSLGDYEYNYDYADFTIKPHNQTTSKPQELTPSSSNQTVSSTKPTSSTTQAASNNSPTQSSTTLIPSRKTTTTTIASTKPIVSVSTEEPTSGSISSSEQINRIENSSLTTESIVSSSEIPINSLKLGEFVETTPVKLKIPPVTSVTIVPLSEVGVSESESTVEADEEQNDVPTLTEILHYRRCANGYSRDKRGRCRKIRRPGVLPFGITRLASNLAAKFRQAASEGTSVASKSAKTA